MYIYRFVGTVHTVPLRMMRSKAFESFCLMAVRAFAIRSVLYLPT